MRNECLLHVDIGGGTTKLSLIDKGVVLGSAAFAVGGRLLATDADGRWTGPVFCGEAAGIDADVRCTGPVGWGTIAAIGADTRCGCGAAAGGAAGRCAVGDCVSWRCATARTAGDACVG